MLNDIYVSNALLLTATMICLGIAVTSLSYLLRSFWAFRRPRYMLLYGALTLVAFTLMQFFKTDNAPVPLAILIFALPALMASFAVVMIAAHGRSYRMVGEESIKECIDRLPIGICCYYKGGQLKQINMLLKPRKKKLIILMLQWAAEINMLLLL